MICCYTILKLFFSGIVCGKLTAPLYGYVKITGYNYGHKATYSCGDGYILVGTAVRLCSGYGDWNEKAPICKREYIGCTCVHIGALCA